MTELNADMVLDELHSTCGPKVFPADVSSTQPDWVKHPYGSFRDIIATVVN